MSGKSTYIRSIALMCVMAQVGSFVPAESATFPLITQLFARVSMDDCIEANVSTFASEMRETAFILRSVVVTGLSSCTNVRYSEISIEVVSRLSMSSAAVLAVETGLQYL